MMAIKGSLLVLVCCVVYATALDKEFVEKVKNEIKDVVMNCKGEVGASDEDIAELILHKVPSSHEGKCLLFCAHKHFHMQKDDGSLDGEGALANLAPLKAQDEEIYGKTLKLFNVCTAQTAIDSDPCVTAGNILECIVKEGPGVGLENCVFD